MKNKNASVKKSTIEEIDPPRSIFSLFSSEKVRSICPNCEYELKLSLYYPKDQFGVDTPLSIEKQEKLLRSKACFKNLKEIVGEFRVFEQGSREYKLHQIVRRNGVALTPKTYTRLCIANRMVFTKNTLCLKKIKSLKREGNAFIMTLYADAKRHDVSRTLTEFKDRPYYPLLCQKPYTYTMDPFALFEQKLREWVYQMINSSVGLTGKRCHYTGYGEFKLANLSLNYTTSDQ